MAKSPQVAIEGARLVFKNFQGAEARWNGKIINEQGRRNFSVVLSNPQQVRELVESGWNVKFPKERDDIDPEDVYEPTLKVNVTMGSKIPPRIKQINAETGQVITLDEDDLAVLDFSNVTNADVVIRGWEYEPGKMAAYLVALYATVENVDPFAEKYAH